MHFRRLTVIRELGERQDGRIVCECECDCGNTVNVNNGYNIKGKEATWHKKVTLGASVGEEEGIRILEYFDKMSISRSEWIREAILDKAKSEGII